MRLTSPIFHIGKLRHREIFILYIYIFFNILFIYLRNREQTEAEGEADSLLSWEPDAGLDPRTSGS